MNKSNFNSAVSILWIALIAVVSVLGYIYGNLQAILPADWYESSDPAGLVLGAGVISSWAVEALIGFPPLNVCAGIALFLAGKTRPKRVLRRHILLLCPFVSMLLMPFWGAYCWMHEDVTTHIVRPADCWQANVLEAAFRSAVISIGFVFLLSMVAKQWQGERRFAFCVAVFELMFALACKVMSSMPVLNCWL